MHHVANYDKASFQVPPAYEKHSQGYCRAALVDHTIIGAVHTGLGLCKLEAGGTLNPHVHFFEEAFFILEGQVLESIDGRDYQLGPGDYGIIQVGVPHAWRNVGDHSVRWLEMLSPQPKAPDRERDTLFFQTGTAPSNGTPPDFRDPMTRYLGHFNDAQMPPNSQLQIEGYRGSSIFGISLKMLVDHLLGAQHLTLFMVEFPRDAQRAANP
jgi:quercetin dioxygenase-like cupin family protein